MKDVVTITNSAATRVAHLIGMMKAIGVAGVRVVVKALLLEIKDRSLHIPQIILHLTRAVVSEGVVGPVEAANSVNSLMVHGVVTRMHLMIQAVAFREAHSLLDLHHSTRKKKLQVNQKLSL